MALVCWYRFSEELLDASGNGHILTNSGGVYVNELLDKAINLAGTEKYLTLPTTINQAFTTFSVCLKVRLSKLASAETHDYHLISLDSSTINVYISSSDDKIYARSENDAASLISSVSTTVTETGVDYDIQFVWDGTDQYLYINGTEEDSDAQSGTITTSGSNLFIGKYPALVRNPEGSIDEVRIYNEVITKNQRRRIKAFNDYYDVRIDGKSYAESLSTAQYKAEIDSVSADFKAEIFDPTVAIQQELNDDMDVMIFQDGVIVYRGQLDLYDNKNGITTTKGLDYTSMLFTRYAIAETFVARTRQFIMRYLVAKYLVKTRGQIYFSVNGSHTGGTSTTVLIDSEADFQGIDNIEIGDIIVNINDIELATIVSIDSGTQITTTALSGSASYNADDIYGIIKDTINELATDTITRSYANTSLAEIFLTFANEEDGQMKTPAISTLPLNINYSTRSSTSIQEDSVDVILDFDNPSNTTAGYKAYEIDFEQESRQVKNTFTVYGPSSAKVGATVRNWASIDVYGEKRAEPITDVDAITDVLCRTRALEEQAKFENPKTKGVMQCNDKASFVVGNTVRMTASEYNISNVAYQVISASHKSFPSRTTMNISSIVRTTDLVLANVLKKQREYDLRDANVEDSSVSEFLTEDYMVDIKFTVTITGSINSSLNSIIGIGKIGQIKIGDASTSDASSEVTDELMIVTDLGKDILRDLIAGQSATHINTTDGHVQFGFSTGTLTETQTELDWTTTSNYDRGDREPFFTESYATSYKGIWSASFTDVELSAGTIVNKIAIFASLTGGTLIAVANLSADLTKVSGNNMVPEITMEIMDGGL